MGKIIVAEGETNITKGKMIILGSPITLEF